jgi:hypothetical protein
MLSHVGCSLACGSMNPSEANLNIWIKPTLFPRSGSFLVVLPRVTEAWWHVWTCRAGAAGLPPGPCAACLRCVCLIQHDCDDFGLLRAGTWDYTRCEPEWWCKVGLGVSLGATMPTLCGLVLRNSSLILNLQIKSQHNSWNLVST